MAAEDQQDKGLDKVTDYAEEKQIDEDQASRANQKAMEATQELEKAEALAKAQEVERQKQLKAVKIDPNDITIIEAEMEISREDAEMKLREAGGDVKAALMKMMV